MKIPCICLIIAGAALAGLPPFSGFFSKELILAQLAALDNPIWIAFGLAGVFLTAYYTFRLIFVILFPKSACSEPDSSTQAVKNTENHETLPHPTRQVMTVPLVVLAGVTVILGFFEGSIKGFLYAAGTRLPEITSNMHNTWIFWTTLMLSAAGVFLAFMEFGIPRAPKVGFAERVPFVYDLFSRRWYIDHAYRFLTNNLVDRGAANICSRHDQKVIDRSIDTLCDGIVESSRRLSFLHTGMIQYRMIVIFATLFFLSLYLLIG